MNTNLDTLIPPDAMIREHSGGISRDRFLTMGEEIVTHSLTGFGHLKPGDHVLDVGCGCGKIARPLVNYLDDQGKYDGIDITNEVVDWCREAYIDHPNFQFHHADLYSERYNPGGKYKAAQYKFPFEDNTFEMVFLGSVFTHLVPLDAENYLFEISRVLKPAGRCLATFFVLDIESRTNIQKGLTTPAFPFEFGSEGCRVENLAIPETAIAYDHAYLLDQYRKYKLKIAIVSFGEWGRKGLVPHWQDEIWSTKDKTL